MIVVVFLVAYMCCLGVWIFRTSFVDISFGSIDIISNFAFFFVRPDFLKPRITDLLFRELLV